MEESMFGMILKKKMKTFTLAEFKNGTFFAHD